MNIPLTLTTWPLEHKTVLLRIDGNVPLENGVILDDYRLCQIVPTIDYIISQKGTIILLTHIGRPVNQEPSLSTFHLMGWFSARYSTVFAQTFEDIPLLKKQSPTLILVENMRFWPEEKKADPAFAQKIARYGDFYVNDAFGTLHRNHTSITTLATLFDQAHKSVGLLVHKELSMLDTLINRHTHPSLVIMGGAKLETKIPLITHLINTVDTLFVGPALSCTFMKAQQIPVGKSLVEDHLMATCLAIMTKAEETKCALRFAKDYCVAQNTNDNPLYTRDMHEILPDEICISVGEKTLEELKKLINHAKIIFINGTMGFSEKPETMKSMKQIFEMLNPAHAIIVIAGGDTVYYARKEQLLSYVTFASTGGGATLQYLSGQALAGLDVFVK